MMAIYPIMISYKRIEENRLTRTENYLEIYSDGEALGSADHITAEISHKGKARLDSSKLESLALRLVDAIKKLSPPQNRQEMSVSIDVNHQGFEGMVEYDSPVFPPSKEIGRLADELEEIFIETQRNSIMVKWGDVD